MRSASLLQCRPNPPTTTPLHHFAPQNQVLHMSSPVIVSEVDITAMSCNPNTIADRIIAVPGLKTSTAFFTFLRANLALPESGTLSNMNTPLLEPTLQVPGPSSSATAQPPVADLDDDTPPLSLDVLTTRDDKVDALRLVADSIAQQRQSASVNLVFHPLNVAALLGSLGVAYQFGGFRSRGDLGTTITLFSGIVMTYLMAIRYFTSQYIQLAEKLNWDWLLGPSGTEDIVIGTRFNGEMIGALVLRLERPGGTSGNGSPSKRRNRGNSALKGGRGVIRAWTTKLRFRGKGVGADMLQEAVRITREKCGKDAAIGFAQEHANSHMVVPEMYNGAFRKNERNPAMALERAITEWEGTRRKR